MNYEVQKKVFVLNILLTLRSNLQFFVTELKQTLNFYRLSLSSP